MPSPRPSSRTPKKFTKYTALLLTEAQWEKVAEIAEHRNMSTAAVIREALDRYLVGNSRKVDEIVDEYQREQKREAGERAIAWGTDHIPLADAQDHMLLVEHGTWNPDCEYCVKIDQQYPGTRDGQRG